MGSDSFPIPSRAKMSCIEATITMDSDVTVHQRNQETSVPILLKLLQAGFCAAYCMPVIESWFIMAVLVGVP
jgi:hypothetical protein